KLSLVRELHTRITDLPGVVAVTSGRVPGQAFRTPAIPRDVETSSTKREQALLQYAYVQPNYFETVGLPLTAGRSFEQQEDLSRSVVLSKSAAQQLWGDENPIGRSLQLGVTDEQFHNLSGLLATGATYRVIGIVGDTRGMTFDGSDSKSVYLAQAEGRMHEYPILIRTRPDATQLLRAVDEVTSSVDPNLNAPTSTAKQVLL